MSEGLLSSNSSPQLFGTNKPPGSYQVCWDDTRIWFIGFLEAYQKMQILLLFALDFESCYFISHQDQPMPTVPGEG